jgi:hypothetical protein
MKFINITNCTNNIEIAEKETILDGGTT